MSIAYGRLWPLLRAALFALPAETAHRLTLRMLAAGLAPGAAAPGDPILAVDLWGRRFPSPIGLAAGFDKNGVAVDGLLGLGFGFVEIGSVTPRPQSGTPGRRLFRDAGTRAVINRMGFNNAGHAAVLAALRRRRRPGLVGVNLGRNKDQPDAAADYVAGIAAFADVADYLVVNISSPNTPGLRMLQDPGPLSALLGALAAARSSGGSAHRPPLLVKIAPDLAEADIEAIVGIAVETGMDGLVVSNTTLARPEGLPPAFAAEAGGLSGRPLRPLALAALRRAALAARGTGGRLPLIGVGGIASGADAYERIRAGASLVQIYTGLVFEGPALVGAIAADLAARLRADGHAGLAQAVGADLR